MNILEDSEKYLHTHYSSIGDYKRDFRNKNLYELISRSITSGTLVDIGSGAGHFANVMSTRGVSVIGVEPNEGLRTLSSTLYPRLTVRGGSGESLHSLVEDEVDTVTMLDVLEHIEDDEAQLRTIHDVLRPGGSLILVVPALPFLYGIRDKRMGHYRRYSKVLLQNVLEKNGFSVTSLRYWNALGVLPYAVSEKILHKPLTVSLRNQTSQGLFKTLLWRALNWWMLHIENRISFGFGLSIICVAKKI